MNSCYNAFYTMLHKQYAWNDSGNHIWHCISLMIYFNVHFVLLYSSFSYCQFPCCSLSLLFQLLFLSLTHWRRESKSKKYIWLHVTFRWSIYGARDGVTNHYWSSIHFFFAPQKRESSSPCSLKTNPPTFYTNLHPHNTLFLTYQ